MIQAVTSENGGQEGGCIAFLCAAILFVGWLLLPHNQVASTVNKLQSHQISIKTLSSKPLSMIADLRLAHEEIQHLYEELEDWQSIAQLQQAWVAPFVKDKSWIHQGQHDWSQIAPGSYQGISAGEDANYILNSLSSGVDIWVDLQQQASQFPIQPEPLQSKQLIKAGWTQVVFQQDEATKSPSQDSH